MIAKPFEFLFCFYFSFLCFKHKSNYLWPRGGPQWNIQLFSLKFFFLLGIFYFWDFLDLLGCAGLAWDFLGFVGTFGDLSGCVRNFAVFFF